MGQVNYRVSIYCRDCTGEDPMGCFEGGSELLYEKKRPYNVIKFEDLEKAKSAGWDAVKDCGPWEFQVLDKNSEVVYNSYE